MVRFTIEEIISATDGILIQPGIAREISGVSIDNRKTTPGNLFVPIIGERLDGHDFINAAAQNGASAALTMKKDIQVPSNMSLILVEDTKKALQALGEANRLRYDIPVIAVTGSSGKTTTKDMIAAVLSQRFNVMKTQGNLNNPLGVPQTMLTLNDSHEAAVVETGTNYPGDIAQTIDEILPKMAVITNIGTAHLEYFKTRENILKGKMEVLSTMTAGDTALLNGDDPYLNTITDTPYNIFRFGISGKDDLLNMKAKEIVSDEKGVSFSVNGESYHCRFPGEHTVRNCLAAIAVAKKLGLTQEEIQSGLDAFVPSGNRMKQKMVDGVSYIDDSYNANPDSMKAALNAFSDLGQKAERRIAVLGDMLEIGDNSPELHQEIGVYAGDKADILIAVGRFAEEYRKGAEKELPKEMIFTCDNALSASEKLSEIVRSGDMVLIKGSNGVGLKQIMDKLKGEESE